MLVFPSRQIVRLTQVCKDSNLVAYLPNLNQRAELNGIREFIGFEPILHQLKLNEKCGN